MSVCLHDACSYYKTMDTYGEAVKKIDKATADAQSILDQMNAQSLVLAQVATQYGVATNHGQNPDAATAAALRAQLLQAQKDLATITARKAQADEDTATARKLADEYQPMIIAAEKDKRSSDFHFQSFAQLTHDADTLQNRADALIKRADTTDGLIETTQDDLAEKRKEFEHYKNRAQVTTASSKCCTVVCRDILDPSTDNLLHILGHSSTDFLPLESTARYVGTCVVFLLRCRTD